MRKLLAVVRVKGRYIISNNLGCTCILHIQFDQVLVGGMKIFLLKLVSFALVESLGHSLALVKVITYIVLRTDSLILAFNFTLRTH